MMARANARVMARASARMLFEIKKLCLLRLVVLLFLLRDQSVGHAGFITVMYASESFAELECRVPVKHPARRNLGRLDATATAIQVGAASRRCDRLRSQRSFYCVAQANPVVMRGDDVRVVLAEVKQLACATACRPRTSSWTARSQGRRADHTTSRASTLVCASHYEDLLRLVRVSLNLWVCN